MSYNLKDCKQLVLVSLLVCLFVSLNVRLVDGDAVSWNYKPGDFGGPGNWSLSFPDCGGVMQSPIDINTNVVLYDPNLQLFDFSDYTKTDNISMELENVGGHTAEVVYSGVPVYLRGGSLPDEYKLEQFHFHWGQNDSRGSEHAFNGYHYPMEMHLVHSQKRLSNVTFAAPHPFGLVVIGVFFRIGKENPKYTQLLENFYKITNASVPDTSTHIKTFAVKDLLPPSTRYDYFRYQGSLTTPPCYESVIWSILTDVVEISEAQVNKFRALYDEERHQLVDDFRPIQSINQRPILTTHLLYKPPGGAASITMPQTITLVMSLLYLAIRLF